MLLVPSKKMGHLDNFGDAQFFSKWEMYYE